MPMRSVSMLLLTCLIAVSRAQDISPAPPIQPSAAAADTNTVIWQGPLLRNMVAQPPGSVTFAWGGVKATFTFSGATRVSMSATKTYVGGPLFRVFVDGSPIKHVGLTMNQFQNYTLAEGLDPVSMHTMVIWYLTDPITLAGNIVTKDSITIKAFYLDDGSFGPAPPARWKNILIIGDSITAGNQLTQGNGCAPDNAETYASRLCELFRANCSTTSLTGKGVWKNCCDDDVTMAELYQRALPGDPLSVMPAGDFAPDAIIVNLGTNDYFRWADEGTPMEIQSIKESYAQFIVKLTVGAGLPSMPVFCAAGPVRGSGHWIEDAVGMAKKMGAQSVYFMNFSTAQQDGCENHPGLLGHQQMFEIARPKIQQVLGWDAPTAEGDASCNLDISPAQLWLEPNKQHNYMAKSVSTHNAMKYEVHLAIIGAVMVFTLGAVGAVKMGFFVKRRSKRSSMFTLVSQDECGDVRQVESAETCDEVTVEEYYPSPVD